MALLQSIACCLPCLRRQPKYTSDDDLDELGDEPTATQMEEERRAKEASLQFASRLEAALELYTEEDDSAAAEEQPSTKAPASPAGDGSDVYEEF